MRVTDLEHVDVLVHSVEPVVLRELIVPASSHVRLLVIRERLGEGIASAEGVAVVEPVESPASVESAGVLVHVHFLDVHVQVHVLVLLEGAVFARVELVSLELDGGDGGNDEGGEDNVCLLYTSPSPRDS